MRDIVLDLRMPPVETAAPASKASYWPWGIAVAAMLAVGIGVFTWQQLNPPEQPLFQTGLDFGHASNPLQFAISPDGQRIAYTVSGQNDEVTLFVGRWNEDKVTPLAKGSFFGNLTFSPDRCCVL